MYQKQRRRRRLHPESSASDADSVRRTESASEVPDSGRSRRLRRRFLSRRLSRLMTEDGVGVFIPPPPRALGPVQDTKYRPRANFRGSSSHVQRWGPSAPAIRMRMGAIRNRHCQQAGKRATNALSIGLTCICTCTMIDLKVALLCFG